MTPRKPRPGPLERAVRRSLAALDDELGPADDGMSELAITLARRLDAANAAGDEDSIAKALWLSPHLANVLKALGVSPEGRRKAGLGDPKPRTGVLEQLRATRRAHGVYHPTDGPLPITGGEDAAG